MMSKQKAFLIMTKTSILCFYGSIKKHDSLYAGSMFFLILTADILAAVNYAAASSVGTCLFAAITNGA